MPPEERTIYIEFARRYKLFANVHYPGICGDSTCNLLDHIHAVRHQEGLTIKNLYRDRAPRGCFIHY